MTMMMMRQGWMVIRWWRGWWKYSPNIHGRVIWWRQKEVL